MRCALKLHPDSRSSAARQVEVEAVRSRAGALVLRYVVSGALGKLALPPVAEPARTDALWRHTCFEAFIRAGTGKAYYEFNFAASTQWAAYRFDTYREGMRVAGEIDAPHMKVDQAPGRFTLQATLQCDRLSGLGGEVPWRVGLSAVLEDVDSGKSYWALAHPPGQPDFHHADCFALKLQ